MAYRPEPDDPFSGGEKVPSLSWRDLPIGSTFTCEVLEAAKSLQSRNYETNEPDFWDPEKTRPKMSAVINVRVTAGPHSVGEERSIWAQIPSNLFIAIKEAQKAADSKIVPGGILHLKFTGETPHENKRYNPIKQYAAKYTAPKTEDPFAPTQQDRQRDMTTWSDAAGRQATQPTQPATKKPAW